MFNFYTIENKKLKLVIKAESIISCLFDEKYNTLGKFSLELPLIQGYASTIKAGMFLKWQEVDTLMYVETVEKTQQSINISGSCAKRILRNRAVIGDFLGGNVEETLHNQVDSLGFDYLTNAPLVGYTDNSNIQVGKATFLTVCEDLTQAVDMGFAVYKDVEDVKFKCYKPVENPNFKLSKSIGNLTNEQATESIINHYDSVVVLGNGFVKRAGNQNSDRKELLVDQSTQNIQEGETQAEFEQRILNFGIMQLGRYNIIEEYKFDTKLTTIEQKARNADKIPTLGDVVSVSMIDFDVVVKARIVGLQTKRQNNVTTQVAEVGTPILVRR